jgi:hypothetical protein
MKELQRKTSPAESKREKAPNGYWTPEKVEHEILVLVEDLELDNIPSRPRLISLGRGDLAGAVRSTYLGGMRRLRANLGFDQLRSEAWTSQRIEQEAQKFFQEEGGFTYTMLHNNKRADLLGAISRSYDGGIRQLRINLVDKYGEPFHQPQRKDDYWTVEQIEKEARGFYQNEHKLTKTSLTRKGRADLYGAILRSYPGKMHQLKVNLGFGVRKPKGYWTAERIEKEAQVVSQNEESLTQRLLISLGRHDLLNAINDYYPGKLTALKEKLGVAQINPAEDILRAYEEALISGQRISFEEFVRMSK